MSMPHGFKHSKKSIEKMRNVKIGHSVSKETRNKISASLKETHSQNPHFQDGSKNPSWKGDKVRYHGIHSWISKNFQKPTVCEICNKFHPKTQWAEKVHQKYSRSRADWLCLCPSCHALYDIEYHGKNTGCFVRNPNNISTKRQCSICKEILPLTNKYFSKSKQNKFGFAYYCKKCFNSKYPSSNYR